MPHFSMNLAIRRAARDKRMTLKKMAWLIGVPVNSMRQVMESRNTYITTIERYAALLGYDLHDFIEMGLQPEPRLRIVRDV